jgi:hypothetical protein
MKKDSMNRNLWTPEEDAILKEVSGTYTIRHASTRLGRTMSACYMRLHTLRGKEKAPKVVKTLKPTKFGELVLLVGTQKVTIIGNHNVTVKGKEVTIA